MLLALILGDGLAVAASGSADHLAVVSSARDEVLRVTAVTEAQPVAAGSVIWLKRFSNEIADPV